MIQTALSNKDLLHRFHKEWYRSIDWRRQVTWRGIPILKNPLDLFIEQEIITEVKPGLIIEVGTAYGGSALFYADILRAMPYGQVITIDNGTGGYGGPDLPKPNMFREDRHLIGYLQFDSMAPKLIETLRGFVEIIVGKNQPVMVILDGDHHAKEVFRELVAYSAFVTPGSYLICEDTNVELVGVLDGDPGPASAIEEFLKTHCNFRVDGSRDKFGLSFNSGGWLRRVA